VLHEAETSHTRLPEPGLNSLRREGPKSRLQDKAALSQEEKEKLAWAQQRIEEGRLHFASKPAMASTGGFANMVDQLLSNKRQRSHESAAEDIPMSKRKRGPKEAGPLQPKLASNPHRKAKVM